MRLSIVITLIVIGALAVQPSSAVATSLQENFKGVTVTFPNGAKKRYPDPNVWAFTFWPGIQWPDSYGDGTNWLAGNAECQTYVTPFLTSAGKSPVAPALRYDPFTIKSDGLHIKASLLTPAQQAAYQIGDYRRFGSGMLLSRTSFTYGKIRVVAKLPPGLGSWPAFWLLPTSHQWPPEIDIMEGMAWGPHTTQIHSGLLTPNHGAGTFGQWFDVGTKVAQGFHTYELDWNADTMTELFDGNVIWQKPTPDSMKQSMYLIINLAVGGTWAFNELGISPIDGTSPTRLDQGSDMIQSSYPTEMVVKSVTVTSP